MQIGVPREIKQREGRVSLIPSACAERVRTGHAVFIEAGAGEKSGYGDQSYRDVSVRGVPTAQNVYGKVAKFLPTRIINDLSSFLNA